MPTIGFNMETVVYKNLQFNVWDLGQFMKAIIDAVSDVSGHS